MPAERLIQCSWELLKRRGVANVSKALPRYRVEAGNKKQWLPMWYHYQFSSETIQWGDQ
jgi:hypothetical protein